MSGGRLRASRAEVVSTAVVLVLFAALIVWLWPRDRADGGSAATPVAPSATASGPELAALRRAAGLAPCPAPDGAPGTGPLAGVVVPCLGTGGRVDVGAGLAGRPALLNVWASWCAPCRAELPALAEYAARPGAVPVLLVDVRDADAPALRLLADLGVRLPSVTDPDGALRAALNLPPAVPVSYVLRADGTAVLVDPPVPFGTADDVAATVERLAG